jgi:ribosomal protein S18 acetylase RimI-like enzyme
VISIGVAASVDDDLCAAVAQLLPQLSSSSSAPTLHELRAIVDDPATTLLVARDPDGVVVGMLTLAVFRVPTGTRAWIEDVVVDGASRGNGAASALVEAALRQAAESGARTVDLTSRPEREAANRLYLHLGFEQRTTNVYRITLGAPD